MFKKFDKRTILGFIIMLVVVILMFALGASCNKQKDSILLPDSEINDILMLVDSMCLELITEKQMVIDSLITIDHVSDNAQEVLLNEINLLKHTMDSVNQSNANLRKYIKHQDAMIKK